MLYLIPILAFFFAFTLLPLLYLVFGVSVHGIYSLLFQYSWILKRALSFTIEQSLLSATLSVLIGFSIAYLSLYTGRRFSSLLRSTSVMAFMLPSSVVAYSFYSLYGSRGIPLGYGFWGIIAAHVFYNAPLAYLICSSAMSNVSKEVIDAIKLYKGRRSEFFALASSFRSAIYSSWILAFLYCFTSMAIPLTLGGPRYWTLEAYIYYVARTLLMPKIAAALSLIQLAFLAPISLLARPRREIPPGTYKWGKKKPFYVPCAAYLVYEGLPIAYMIFSSFYDFSTGSFTLRGYEAISRTQILPALMHTAYFTAIALLLGIGMGTAFVLSRRLVPLATMPIAISPVTLGLGYFVFYEGKIPVWLLIPIAYSILSVPLVTRSLEAGYLKISKEILEASRLFGYKGWKFLSRVLIPLLSPSYAVSVLFVSLTSIGEFGATMMLYTPSTITLSVLVYTLLGGRNLLEASVAATILVAIIGGLSWAIRETEVMRRWGQKWKLGKSGRAMIGPS